MNDRAPAPFAYHADSYFWPRPVAPAALPRPRWRLAAAMLAATAVTTTVVGARLQYNFARGAPAYATNEDLLPFAWAWHHPAMLWGGLTFSLALMAILLAHELGHYLTGRRYGLDSTLPYFIPAPTILGTFGAFIRIRSPFRSRRELFDVGVAGPLAGMAVALPILVAGLWQSHGQVPAGAAVTFQWPLLGRLLIYWMRPGLAPARLNVSPLARAGWVGLLVTMLNLLPGAQLDGGHILYSMLPRLHRPVSLALAALLLAAGWFYWPGWFIWAAMIVAMRARHPAVFGPAPGTGRVMVALVAAMILAMTFLLVPVI